MAKKLVCGKSFRIKEQHQSKSASTGRRFQTKEISSTKNEKVSSNDNDNNHTGNDFCYRSEIYHMKQCTSTILNDSILIIH